LRYIARLQNQVYLQLINHLNTLFGSSIMSSKTRK